MLMWRRGAFVWRNRSAKWMHLRLLCGPSFRFGLSSAVATAASLFLSLAIAVASPLQTGASCVDP